MKPSHSFSRREQAAALVIVLAFVVLLLGLSVAYLSRTTTDREVAQGSFNQSKADQLALSAADVIEADFLQEIVSGSTQATGNSNGIVYIPAPNPNLNSNVVPRRSGNPPLVAGVDPVPNLIRRSVYPDTIVAPGLTSRASAVSSTAASLNGRAITTTRWNSHYLIPKLNTTDDSIPATGVAPDWVIVTRNGPTSFSGWDSTLKDSTLTNTNYVVGRYAYAVYDEGGLLDINVAGFPNPPSPSLPDIGRKGIVTFADLTALPTTPSASYVTNAAINPIVEWRNYQTAQVTGSFPSSMSIAAISNFVTYFLGSNPQTGTTANFGVVATAPAGATRTDQGFLTRQQLIKLRADTGAGAASMLQYLGTFSREQNAPTWRWNGFAPATAYPFAARFPLSNLALVISGASNVQTTFGLIWATDHWKYVGTSGSTVQASIASPIAGQAPAPDFFQILSFARTSATGTVPSPAETLSTGASIIDQYDLDGTATKIEYDSGSKGKYVPAYALGMEAPASPMLNRRFRNVGELGYAFKNSNAATSLDFKTTGTPVGANLDSGVLDFFTYNTATLRSGTVNLNSRNPYVLAAVIMGALPKELSASGISLADATAAAKSIVAETTDIVTLGKGPALGRADVSRLASAGVVTNSPFTTDEESREAIARALAEVGQTRTWGLLIDVIAQSGRYSPAANALADFTVEGEQRYWVHVAIDRFTGLVIDRQVEVVKQ